MTGEEISPGNVPPDAYARFVSNVRDSTIFLLDPRGRIASWPPSGRALTGHEPADVLGKPVAIFYPAPDVAALKPEFALRVAAGSDSYEDEGWRLRKDGSMFWASCTLTAVRGDDGSILGFGKSMRDRTARKQAEDALRQSEERFRLLSQSVRDYAIFLLDPRGHVMSWNEGAKHLKGYDAEEIVGEHFGRFYSEQDRARMHPEHELEIAVREGRYAEEGWRVRKDGSRFWASVTITALHDQTGKHVGFAKVTRDLTLRKQGEDELRARAQSYAQLNRELDAFSHTVAHDLRSPIRAVEHLSSVLLEEEQDRLTSEGKETLRALHKTALGMARLVQDLLELSTASGREPARTDVDVTAVARDVAAETSRALPDRAIEFRIESGLRAHADAHLLRVALANLVGNAAKFTRSEEKAVVEIGSTMTPRGRAFFVRDNGVGFDPSRAEQLFQPFARFHSQAEFEGTGIGLATVRRIVARHGGEIWAASKPGQGATFYFTLDGGI